MNDFALPRLVSQSLAARLKVMPAVVVTGSRQTGKSTLVRELVALPRRYFSLDDLEVAEVASRDPGALVGLPDDITLDEVQRCPKLLSAVKLAIDAGRWPGRFLLTGSANLLLMQGVSESLAGRASYLTLWPMTVREQRGEGRCGCWDELLAAPPADWIAILSEVGGESRDWRELALGGGFPAPALQLQGREERAIWFDGYVRTYLERDLHALSAVSSLPDFRRLMRALSLRLGQVANQTALGRDLAMPQPTVHRYMNLLETSYLLVRLPAFATNRGKRLVKAPKLYWGDTGVALHLAAGVTPTGAHLENLVLGDLLAWRDSRPERADLFYWRTTVGHEVDFVVETNDRLLPIEVKAGERPALADATHLRTFRADHPDRSLPGLLLHGGSQLSWIAPDVLAAPWWRVL